MARKSWCIGAAVVLLEVCWVPAAFAQQSGTCYDAHGNAVGTWSWPDTPACTFQVPYPTTTRQVPVSDGTALQNALNNALGGDVILLTPGVVYSPPAGSASF